VLKGRSIIAVTEEFMPSTLARRTSVTTPMQPYFWDLKKNIEDATNIANCLTTSTVTEHVIAYELSARH